MINAKTKLNHILIVGSALLSLQITLFTIIGYIFGGWVSVILLEMVLTGILIFSTIFVISKGYLNSRKVRSAFILIALPSMGFNLFYYNSFKREVETSTLSKVVDAKVITEANFSSNYRLVLLSDGDILTVDDARNIRDFKIGDKVTSIDNVKETIHLTDIFGKERTGVSEYVLLKGKE